MKFSNFFLFIFIISIAVIQPVSAYLDPGTGSIIWQMLIAVGFGIVYSLKMYWHKIKNIFKKDKTDVNDK